MTLIEKYFKNTDLSKVFNKKNVKLFFSCLSNIQTIILGQTHCEGCQYESDGNQIKEYNCEDGPITCPMGGKCLEKDLERE